MRDAAAIFAFGKCRSGTTSIEYSVIGAGLSILIVAGAQAIGINLNVQFFTKLLVGFQ